MIYTHLHPGNVIRYNGQVWLIVEQTKKTLHLVGFNNSKAKLVLNTKSPTPPVYLAENATSYVIGLLSETY